MKQGCLVFLAALFCLPVFSQQGGVGVLPLNALPADGLVLDQHWTFHPKDDIRYAESWESVDKGISLNPAGKLDQLPEVKKAGIGWFRLKMQVDPSLRNKTIGMMVSLFGAAEIYLNGKQVYQYGQVSPLYTQEKTQAIYARAVSLTLGNEEYQLLAVRFSNHPNNLNVHTGIVPSCMGLTLYPLNKAIDRYAVLVKKVYRFFAITLTIELAAALLTLFFFFSFPARKEYLYFGIYFTLNFFAILVQGVLTGVSKEDYISVSQLSIVQMLVYVFLMAGSLYHVNAVYALLKQQRTRYYWFLFWYAVLSMALLMVLPGWGSVLPVFFFPLACLEILPAYFKAARQKFKGAWTLFFSVLLCLLFLLILVQVNMESVAVLTALVLVTPALGVMIFIAGDFARTSSALQQQIVEVEALSEKNLAHEREKQDILAIQKDELEKEVEVRTAALRQSLADLKAAQAKLVQAEKMASLGEVTAGVAHEIQNPLNFINNFSELSIELSGELHDEVANAQLSVEQKRLLQDTVSELVKNQEKILHHGRRADAIVKNMLQHSRKSGGTKEATNINDLVEQYLQLSFHGLRARDKEFNTALQKDFDESVTDIPVVPQDIGRVLLNLFNNAFYAVREKKKKLNGTFEPAVSVHTKKEGNKVIITISDNGLGIPRNIADKIFQPFFTTKPAGEGTGLGLSLSYDIITKGHGGQLTVTSTEGEGSSFMILLPLG